MKVNLLEELLAYMASNSLHEKDVLWVGSSENSDLRISWENFKEVAAKSDFKDKIEVARDIIIIFKDCFIAFDDDDFSDTYFNIFEIPYNTSEYTHINRLIKYNTPELKDESLTILEMN